RRGRDAGVDARESDADLRRSGHRGNGVLLHGHQHQHPGRQVPGTHAVALRSLKMPLLRRGRASAVLLGLGAWGAAPAARAYPWMIKHDYAACAVCHADPSGGGLLTAYGRAQSELLVRMPYGANLEEEPRYAGFLYGLVNLPDWLLATVSYRGA